MDKVVIMVFGMIMATGGILWLAYLLDPTVAFAIGVVAMGVALMGSAGG